VLLVLNSFRPENKSIYTLDKSANKATPNILMDGTDNGFSSLTRVLPFKSGVLIFDDGIYYYDSKDFIQLQDRDNRNSFDIAYNSQNFYFKPLTDPGLKCFDGRETNTIVEDWIGDFKVSEEVLYYEDRTGDNLMAYNFSSGISTVITDYNNFIDMEVIDDKLYYYNENILYVVNQNSQPEEVINGLSYPNISSSFPVLKMNNELIIPTETGLYSLDSVGELSVVKSGDMVASSLSTLLLTKSGDHLLFGNQDSLFHYDENLVYKSDFDILDYYVLRQLGANHFYSWRHENNAITGNIYDAPNDQFFPNTFEHGIISNIFEINGTTFALAPTKRGEIVNCFSAFEFDNDLLTFTEKTRFENVAGSSVGDVIISENGKGLLMAGSRLVRIDNNSYEEVLDISVEDNRDGFLKIDSLVYFIGIDKDLGRQLYSYNPNASSTKMIEESHLKNWVYPNPAEDFLTIDLSSLPLEIWGYSIYDMTGKKMNGGSVSDHIAISYLPSGVYCFVLEGSNYRYASVFVKE